MAKETHKDDPKSDKLKLVRGESQRTKKVATWLNEAGQNRVRINRFIL